MRKSAMVLRLRTSALVGSLSAAFGISAAAPADLTLSIDGECPGLITAVWEGGTPNAWGALVFSLERGSIILPSGPCGQTFLDLGPKGLRFLPPRRTGPDGRGEIIGRVPNGACGGYLQMIMLDDHPCTTSNVARIPE